VSDLLHGILRKKTGKKARDRSTGDYNKYVEELNKCARSCGIAHRNVSNGFDEVAELAKGLPIDDVAAFRIAAKLLKQAGKLHSRYLKLEQEIRIFETALADLRTNLERYTPLQTELKRYFPDAMNDFDGPVNRYEKECKDFEHSSGRILRRYKDITGVDLSAGGSLSKSEWQALKGTAKFVGRVLAGVAAQRIQGAPEKTDEERVRSLVNEVNPDNLIKRSIDELNENGAQLSDLAASKLKVATWQWINDTVTKNPEHWKDQSKQALEDYLVDYILRSVPSAKDGSLGQLGDAEGAIHNVVQSGAKFVGDKINDAYQAGSDYIFGNELQRHAQSLLEEIGPLRPLIEDTARETIGKNPSLIVVSSGSNWSEEEIQLARNEKIEKMVLDTVESIYESTYELASEGPDKWKDKDAAWLKSAIKERVRKYLGAT
jgi:hypothetical protein